MTDQQIKSFIDVTLNYFEKTTKESAKINSPYIEFARHQFSDFTGMIQISGQVEGSVLITAPREMLDFLVRTWVSTEVSENHPQDLEDMIGELANIIASNVRKDFGPTFKVSTPRVFTRETEASIDVPEVTLVLPIEWRTFACQLVIGLREGLAA